MFKIKKYSSKNQKSFLLIGLLISILIFIGIQNFNNYFDSLDTSQQKRITNTLAIASGTIDNNTTSKRSELFKHGIKKISARPLFGYGTGAFHQFKDGPYELGIHNTFLVIFGESGIIPFALFLTVLFSLLIKGYFHKDYKIAFFITAIVLIFSINLYGTSHNSIVDRPSNILLGIFFALIENQNTKIE